MSVSDDYQVPVRDGHSALPEQTAPEEMYWLRHMSREELLEKLVSLRDDFYTLKKFSCRQEDKIKKLQTKLRKLISDKKKDDKGGASYSIKEMEYQEALDKQQHTIQDLRLKTQHMEKRLKLASIQLNSAKKNKPMLFHHVGPRVDSGLKHSRAPPPSSRPPLNQSPPKASPSLNESSSHSSAASIHQKEQLMPERIREILEEARERIVALEAERDDLQDQLAERQQAAENAEYEGHQRIALLEEEVANLKEELHHQGVKEERSSVAAVRAERESHTLSARTVALQEQLVATEEKVASERMRKDALHSELERMTEKLLAAENQLRGVQEEQQRTAGKLLEVTEKNKVYEKENQQLKSENDRLTTLNFNFKQKGLTAENEALKAQIAHLESALQSDLSERGSFLEHMTRDKEDLARAEEEIKELRERLSSLQEELQKANTKLSVYDKAGLLKLPEKDPALLQLSVDPPSHKEFEKLQEAHSELQLLYREKCRELEQLSVTLVSHSTTYQALQTQVARVTQESEEKEKHLNRTVRSLQDTIKRRDERCDKLEAQILILTNQGMREKLEDLGSCLTQTVGLGKHDNVLEFHIDRVVFEPPEFSSLKTFVSWTVPFSLEDPLQHTNVARGSEAHYNYSALYKFQMNSRNLMSLREDTVTASVYILLDSGHPAKVGECAFTFQEILDHPRNTLHGIVPVMLAHDDAEEAQHLAFMAHIAPGQIIGNMSYWFRLQRPSEDAIAQYLRTSGTFVAAHRDKSVLKETTVTKSNTSSGMVKCIAKVDKKLGSEQIPKKEEGRDTPVPAPRLQKHPSLSPNKKSSSSEKIEGNISSGWPHVDTLEHTEHTPCNSVSRCEGDNHGHQSLNTDPGVQQIHSRSGSNTSSRTYNVEIPMKSKTSGNSTIEAAPRNLKNNPQNTRPTTVNSEGSSSDSSTGTYNVDSPKISKIAGNSKLEVAKISGSSELKRSKSDSSSASSGRSSNHEAPSLTSNRRSVQSKSSSHAKEEETTEKPEEEPSTSHLNTAAVPPPPPPHHMPVSSENSSDSLLEENKNPEKYHTHSPQDTRAQRGEKGIKSIAAESAKERNRKSDKSTTEIKAQHQLVTSRDTCSKNSNNSSKEEESEDSDSSSESCHTSDSEGVVAVTSKRRKAKSQRPRVYIEVSSLTLWPDCGVLQDPMVELVFVDYHGFLGLPPDQLETPLSLPKNAPDNTLNFNFEQEFSVDKNQYPGRVHALKELMSSRGILKFTVTSEPSEEMQETRDCQDLGYAYVDLHQLVQERQDIVNETLPVESAEDGSQIGVLRVTLHIIQALQYLGLA